MVPPIWGRGRGRNKDAKERGRGRNKDAKERVRGRNKDAKERGRGRNNTERKWRETGMKNVNKRFEGRNKERK